MQGTKVIKHTKCSYDVSVMQQHHDATELTTPTRYGLPASPSACEISIWNASAVDRLTGTTTYCNIKSNHLAV